MAAKQRLLERFDRADVGLRLALADRDAHAGLRNVGAAASDHLAALGQLVDLLAGHDQEIVRLAVRQPLHGVERAGEHRRDLVAGRLLELRHQLLVGFLGGLRGQDLDLGGTGRAREQQRGGGDRQSGLHVGPPLMSFML